MTDAHSGQRFDCVVIGLGAIGSATCYSLARAGASVLGLEQFELGHARGASHDHTRIIRRSYHTAGYVELAGAAYEAWDRVESEEPLVIRTGGIDLFPAGAVIPIDDYTRSMTAADVPFEELDAAAVMARWPQWRLDPDVVGLYQADTGMVAAERATAALRRGAIAHGATLRGSTAVRALRDEGTGIAIETDAGERRADRVVIAADAWTNELLAGLDWQIPLDVTQEQLTYTRPVDLSQFVPQRFPVWIWMDEPSWYGFPEFGEAGWVKTAQDCGGRIVTADTRTFDPDPDAEARLLAFLADALPGAATGETMTKTCLYTLTPDRDFVLDAVPDHPDVFVALGAAHGFKFAAVFGEIMRDLALGAASPHDLSAFRIDRDALTTDHPVRTWLI
jgi:sarcosine oxidase